MRSARPQLFIHLAGVSLIGLSVACGSTPPKTPDAEASASAGADSRERPGAAETKAASAAPAMSGAAASAYAAGMQAFEAGDLDGAGQQFSRAIAADSSAYPAHMALGTVQERRAETAKALDSYARALEI